MSDFQGKSQGGQKKRYKDTLKASLKENVQVGNDQGKAQPENNSHYKNPGGKNQIDN